VTGLCAPRRLCQPPACPVFCLACLTSREPRTCTHARICTQACYANHLPTVKAMILSAIAVNGSDPWLHSPADDRPHGGLPTACLLRHFGLPARRYLLTTPICENGLNCQGAETCERLLDPKRLCQPPGCVAADGAKMSPCGPDCMNSRRPWKCVHTALCARAHYANRLPTVQAMCPSSLCARARYVPELAMCPSLLCQLSAHGARLDAHEPTNCHHS
jgi:hypothetical protein